MFLTNGWFSKVSKERVERKRKSDRFGELLTLPGFPSLRPVRLAARLRPVRLAAQARGSRLSGLVKAVSIHFTHSCVVASD